MNFHKPSKFTVRAGCIETIPGCQSQRPCERAAAQKERKYSQNSAPNCRSSGFPGSSQSALNDTSVDVGALCPGWVAQPSSTAAFQPLGHWAPSEYFQHEQSLSTLPPLTSDMYVQPVCPSYAVVGPSSVLTFAHTPLFTNLGTISSSSSGLPQIDVQDGSLAYIPWATPMSPCPQNVAPQPLAMPVPVPVSEPEPQQKEPAPTSEGTLALEKLLEEEEEQKEPYACSPSLFTQDI
ncbi:POU domain class 2-associating factor 1 isoform X3 [Tachysurus fulvidraco]|uniref:POU domain class 2-associating factor 1 isoform X3 n=1 Tax=Tachysurus fulvidraco TaxID=1234273 RepID=UPI001FF05CE4|nr:POU domain class 2-associating factor 1 isoform X3 [Tachysurus fulvidraco]